MSRFLELAKKLQTVTTKNNALFDYGVDARLIPKTLTAMSQIVHIPTRYQKHFEEDLGTESSDLRILRNTSELKGLSIRQLAPKALRHNPNDDFLAQSSPKNYGKKVYRIEGALREILETRHLAKTLRVDKWRISSLSLSANERTCFVFWNLDESVPTNMVEREIVNSC
jgi:hypothetical protein